MIKIFPVYFLLFLMGCSIEIMPKHYDNDLSGKNNNSVNRFTEDSILTEKKVTIPASISLEEINYSQLQIINKKSARTWVILTVPWCAECAVELENNSKKINELKNLGINTVLIYSNYDVKNIRKELFKIGYNKAYILNVKDYSSNESDKISRFGNQILANSDKFNKLTAPAAVPQNFFFTSGNLSMYKCGRMINIDSVKYYFR